MPTWWSTREVNVIAHRCNDIESVARRHADGAHALEVDVQELGDGSLVAHHDGFVLDHDGEPAWLRDLDLSRFRALSPDVPTMSEVLDEVEAVGAGLYLDVHAVGLGALERLLIGVNGHGLGRATVVASARGEVVWSAAAAGWPSSLMLRDRWIDPVAAASDAQASIVHPCVDDPTAMLLLGDSWAGRLRSAEVPVVSWNAESPTAVAALCELGVAAICCEEPRWVSVGG
jgi:hypothetical protein